jgi:hypothetical protein
MDLDRFDALTRDLLGRRPALTALVGGIAGFSGLTTTPAKKRRRKRCRKPGRVCNTNKKCCHQSECIDGACCQPERIYVECPDNCRCTDDPSFCCAFESQPPETCEPATADILCCPPEHTCGDVCCNPATERCVGGVCECLPAYARGGDSQCCDPQWSFCLEDFGLCECFDPLGCPSGGSGYLRIRRLR